MQSLFSVAQAIATPLSLSALMLLILFYLFRYLFERLKLESIVAPDVYKIVMRAMTFLFVLAIVALVLGLLAYATIAFLKHLETARIDSLIAQLQHSSEPERVSAIKALALEGRSSTSISERICSSLMLLVRKSSKDKPQQTPVRIAEDIQASVVALGEFTSAERCRNVDLSGSDLRRLQFNGKSLRGATLTSARLDHANLVDADLSNARMMGVNFTEAKARQAKLVGASLQDIVWRNSDLTDTDFTGAKGLAGADLMQTTMKGAILDKTDLSSTKLSNETMTNASFKGADIRQTDFSLVRGVCAQALKEAIGPPRRSPLNDC